MRWDERNEHSPGMKRLSIVLFLIAGCAGVSPAAPASRRRWTASSRRSAGRRHRLRQALSVVVFGGTEAFRAGEEPDQLPRIMDEHGQVLRTDLKRAALIFERKERNEVGAAVTEETGRVHESEASRAADPGL